MAKDKYFVIDFDSTLVQCESLDELAAIALKKKPNRESVLAEIRRITEQGMVGTITIQESLDKRLKLLSATRQNISVLIKILKKKITPSFLRNKAFLKKNASKIFVITSGFKEFVIPVIKELGLKSENTFANSFEFDKNGQVVGLDRANPLSKQGGKAKILKGLKLKGQITAIGDGYTDYELKESGAATDFFAFFENVYRESVAKKADRVVKSFDEFLFANRLPMRFSYPRSKLKVLLLENIHPLASEMFKKEGFAVEEYTDALDETELSKRIRDVSLLGIRSKTKVTPRVLESAERLLGVGAYCIGTDQIDLQESSLAGIAAFNAPYSNTRSVVEIVAAEIVVLLRHVFEASNSLHKGVWLKSASGCHEVRGKRLGIIGYGNIGSQLSVLAEAMGMEVLYYDIVEKLSLGKARKCRSLHDLLHKVDVVSVHVDGRASNENLIGESEFKAMKDGAIFINFSRGKIVNISALVKNLRNGKISSAGIDVFPYEPKGKNEKFVSELRGLPNVILTPHIGGSTVEAQRNIAEFVTTRMLDYVNNGSSFGSINFPQIQLPTLTRAHRLLHVHENVPGILAQINNSFASNHINILGQYLKTTDQIGYVITDVNRKYNKNVIEELKNIPHTIRFRVLY